MTADPRTLETAPGPVVRIGGREFLYFAGTGYLGLQGHPDVIVAGQRAFADFGLHPAASRATCGESIPVLDVERALTEFFGTEAALYVPSGYAGAAMLVAELGDGFDRVFVDECAHYSVLDAAALGGREVHAFGHCDTGSLADELQRHSAAGERPLVMTDGVFAATGNVAPLRDYAKVLSATPSATMLIDDAHGVGVLGERGHGAAEAAGLATDPRVRWCATTSKALGGYGGFVCGDQDRIDALRRGCRWFVGTTTMPSPVAAATACALRIARAEPERRARLHANVARLRDGLRRIGLDFPADKKTPIFSLALGDPRRMQDLQSRLEAAGIYVPYVAAYSGTDAAGALRTVVFATHSDDQIDRLLTVLDENLPR